MTRTPLHEKPARLIARLTEVVRGKDAEIDRLKAELDHARKSAALHLARESERDFEIARYARKRGELASRLQVAERDVAALDHLNAFATAALADLEASSAELRRQIDQARGEATQARAERDVLAARLEGLEPELQILEEKRSELTRILDDVRDRMRRRDLQDEQAILNRRTLAGAKPARNFR